MTTTLLGKALWFVGLLIVGCALTFALFWILVKKPKAESNDPRVVNLSNIPGLSVGETVDLPELATLDGKMVSLKGAGENYLFCAIFTTECAGCTQDSEIWRHAKAEAAKRRVAFFLISSDDDQARVKRFAVAYELADLPLLFDPNHKVLRNFKITFVPQYVLMTSSGKVIQRWTGVQNNEVAPSGSARAAEFFQSIPSSY